MRPQSPCKDCEDRKPGCHDRCDKYKAFREEILVWEKQLNTIKYNNAYFDERARENADKYRHARYKRK